MARRSVFLGLLFVATVTASCASSAPAPALDGGKADDGSGNATDGITQHGDGLIGDNGLSDGPRDLPGNGDGSKEDLLTDRQDGQRDLPSDHQDGSRDGPQPSTDGNQPVTDGNQPTTDGNQPTIDGTAFGDGAQPAKDGPALPLDGPSKDTGVIVPGDSATLPPDGPALQPLSITTISPLPLGIGTKSYSATFAAMGGLGSGSYSWSGTVPWGTLDPKTGVLSGAAPAGAKTYTLSITVKSGTQSDTKSFSVQIVDPLRPSGSVNPTFTYAAPGPTNIGTLVQGGKGPFACAFYAGRGRGTLPSGLTQAATDTTGCTITGGFTAADAPGSYGFIVTVSDASGQKTDVAVVVRNGSCNNGAATLTPAEYPPRRISNPAINHDWTLKVDPVDSVCQNSGCTQCNVCLSQSAGTLLPLRTTNQLDCTLTGDLCALPSTFGTFTCPNGKSSWIGGLRLKAHTPFRSDGGPAFATFDYSVQYSGTISSATACGNKTWKCHWEALEL